MTYTFSKLIALKKKKEYAWSYYVTITKQKNAPTAAHLSSKCMVVSDDVAMGRPVKSLSPKTHRSLPYFGPDLCNEHQHQSNPHSKTVTPRLSRGKWFHLLICPRKLSVHTATTNVWEERRKKRKKKVEEKKTRKESLKITQIYNIRK